jgi:hypothetical protein
VVSQILQRRMITYLVFKRKEKAENLRWSPGRGYAEVFEQLRILERQNHHFSQLSHDGLKASHGLKAPPRLRLQDRCKICRYSAGPGLKGRYIAGCSGRLRATRSHATGVPCSC